MSDEEMEQTFSQESFEAKPKAGKNQERTKTKFRNREMVKVLASG